MPKVIKPPVRARRSKAEVDQEFSKLEKQVGADRESTDAKAEEASRFRDAEVRQAVDGITVEGVVAAISGLGLEISKSLGDITAKLTQEVDLLASVREAVGLERRELERLHKIDLAATAVDQMVAEYSRQKEQLESEIAAQRAEWEEESRTAERDRKEQDEALRKQRQREIDDYEYKKALERKKGQDKYDEEVRQLDKSNRDRQAALEKSWQEREAALKDREDELGRLRKESEEFPARIRKEVEAAAAAGAKSAEVRLNQDITMLKKDAESEKRITDLQIKTLEDMLARSNAQAQALQKQLDDAKKQVQEIAVKAIEGASGSRALAHVNEIAIEQAKNRPHQG